MQTNQNLGQIAVLGASTFLLNICLAVGSTPPAGYGAAFAVLLIPSLLLVTLSTRTRGA
ncbi:hypothetical protein [Streptomyces tsukubensis]|uniref:hypothetical protein n=1 Tax=Streptomyces tsukubensis TaxID=83656 RepID=UPI0015C34F43|nr:hypothetical protein [Streptomyces tsukubensis]